MKSGASVELISVGRPSSLAGLFGDSSCRLPFPYCNRERCTTKLVRTVFLLLLMITFRFACWEPCCRWEEEVVGRTSKNYNQKTLPCAAVAINLLFPPYLPQVFELVSLCSAKSSSPIETKLWGDFLTVPCSYLAIFQPQYRSTFHFLMSRV